MTAEDSFDIIVVGAGVVGSALSTALGRTGRRVAVVERDLSEPDRIVGELLQPGGVRALQLLGLSDTLEGIDAIPTDGYHIFLSPTESIKIRYPATDELPASYGRSEPLGTEQHYAGRSFHHGRFIQNLRRCMMAQPNVTVRQGMVTHLEHGADGRVVGVSGTFGTMHAPVTVVADGIFSKFRKQYGGSYEPEVRSHFVGVEIAPDAVLSRHHGHVILNQKAAKAVVPGQAVGPALVYQIGSDATRLLVDVPGPKLPSVASGELERYLRNCVVPCLPDVIGTALLTELDKGVRLRTMPNSFLPPSMQGVHSYQRGMVMAGDAMNMRHPLTGGGMTVAFWDCVYLAHILGGGAWSPLDGYDDSLPVPPAARDLANWRAVQPLLRAWHWKRKRLASVINVLAMSLYSLFGVPDDNLTILRIGCFRYFERGGACVRDPISLLAGLAPDPLLLVYHFFAVAVYSVQLLFRGELYATHTDDKAARRAPRVTQWPMMLLRALIVLLYACYVIFPVIYTELRTNLATKPHAELFLPSLVLLSAGAIGVAATLPRLAA